MIHCLVAALSLASAASAAVTTVTVGQGGLVYTPNNIVAAVGDVVNFKFTGSPGNHTVSQADFSAPCQQLTGGFDSGFVFVPSGFSGTTPEYNLTITDASTPIYFYCKQKGTNVHCIAGMVGAINSPSSGNTLDAFVSAAKGLGSFPAQVPGNVNGGIGATASAGPTATSSGTAATSTAPSGSSTAGASPSATTKNAALRPSAMSSTGLWTLLAGLLGVVVA